MLGVTKGDPVPIDVPPLDAVYQLSVPVQPDAESVTVPVPQFDPPLPVGAVGIAFTVAVTGADELVHPAALVAFT